MEKEKLISMIPKNKFDIVAAKQLLNLEKEEIRLILPQIIGWIADPNWPIAEFMSDVLLKYPEELLPYVKKYLSANETDEEFKGSIIMLILPRLPIEMQRQLLVNIERICSNPTESEKCRLLEITHYYMNSVANRHK